MTIGQTVFSMRSIGLVPMVVVEIHTDDFVVEFLNGRRSTFRFVDENVTWRTTLKRKENADT